MRNMFRNCKSLKKLPNINNWNIKSLKKYDNMFEGCNGSFNIPKKFK